MESVDHSLVHDIASTLIRLIWFLLTVIESIIGLRVLFRALGAQEEGFVRFVYLISNPLVARFRPIIGDQAVGTERRHVIEVSSLVAMLLFFLAAYLLVMLISLIGWTGDEWQSGAQEGQLGQVVDALGVLLQPFRTALKLGL